MSHTYGLDGDQKKAIEIAIDRIAWAERSLSLKLTKVRGFLERINDENSIRHLKERLETEEKRLIQAIEENHKAIAHLKELLS